MPSVLAAILLLAPLVQAPGRSDAPSPSQVRARLSAYEAKAATGQADPRELAAIASDAVSEVTNSGDPVAVVQACSSTYARTAECAAKLWTLARDKGIAVERRIDAASLLVRTKDAAATSYLLELVAPLTAGRLATVAESLIPLPAEKSVPLLARVLQSNEAAAQESACRALGRIDASGSRQAIQDFLSAAPRGTHAWNACTLAAAKLGDPAAQTLSAYISMHLAGDELIDAAEVIMNADRERAVSLLMQVTRESRGYPQLEAAERLADIRPDITTDIMQHTLSSGRPEMVAAALQLHRALHLDPDQRIRARLVDPNPLVRLRAAETTLAADERRRARGG